MLENIKARFRSEKLSPEEQADFLGELYFTNYRRYRVFTVVLLPIFMFLTALDLVNREKGLWGLPGYHELFYIHAATALLLILSIIALFIRSPRAAAEVRMPHRALLMVITAYVMISLQFITFADVTIHGNITAYVTMALAIGAVTLLRPAEGLVFYAACLALFVAGMDRFVKAYSPFETHLVNGTAMTVIALVLSRIAYSSFRVNHLHKKKIERQNEEIRLMDEKLRLSELEYHHLFEHSPIGVFRNDRSGKVLAANQALLRMLGFGSLDELNAKGFFRLYIDQSDRANLWERAMKGPVSGFETLFRKADGSAIPVSISCSITVGEAGAPLFIEGTLEDISERKREEMLKEAAAAALKQSEERYRLLADNSDDVIFTLDTGLQFTYISPSVLKLRGYSCEEAALEKLEGTMTADSYARCMAEYARLKPDIERGGNPNMRIEIEQYRKDRSTVWVEVNIRTMRDETGRLTGYVGVSRDITERKRNEQALRDLEGRRS
jgi:PAS domain S-box-containing protein